MEIQESLDHEDITKLTVKKIDYPDLEYFKTFGQNTTFSSFNAKHVEYASALIKIFHDCKDLEELISMGLYIRDQINRHLFAYAFYVVLTHRYDTDNIILPQYFEIAPNSFFKKDIFSQIAKTNYISLSEPGQRRRRQANSAQKVYNLFTIKFLFFHFLLSSKARRIKYHQQISSNFNRLI